MKLTELIEIAMSSRRIPDDVASELLEHGVSAFLSEGVPYSEALDILARAQESTARATNTRVSFPQPSRE